MIENTPLRKTWCRYAALGALLWTGMLSDARANEFDDICARIKGSHGLAVSIEPARHQHLRWAKPGAGDGEALLQYARLFAEEISKHDPMLLRNGRIEKVWFVKSLHWERTPIAMSTSAAALWLDIEDLNDADQRRVRHELHHRIYHIVADRLPWHAHNPKWALYNPPGWRYPSDERFKEKWLPLGCDGGWNDLPFVGPFVSQTAQMSIEEDQAEVFARLFLPIPSKPGEERVADDPLLAQKFEHMKRFVAFFSQELPDNPPAAPPGEIPSPDGPWAKPHYFSLIVPWGPKERLDGDSRTVRDPSHARFINATWFDDWRPLHFAAAFGRPQTMRAMLEVGAEVNATDTDGLTPLHLAAAAGHESIVRMLVAAGADRAATDRFGRTPDDLRRYRAGNSAKPSRSSRSRKG